jgi:hypothetical protein
MWKKEAALAMLQNLYEPTILVIKGPEMGYILNHTATDIGFCVFYDLKLIGNVAPLMLKTRSIEINPK